MCPSSCTLALVQSLDTRYSCTVLNRTLKRSVILVFGKMPFKLLAIACLASAERRNRSFANSDLGISGTLPADTGCCSAHATFLVLEGTSS